MSIQEEALELHARLRGKIAVSVKKKLTSLNDLSVLYTPGVAEPCRMIAKNKSDVYKYTIKGNSVAVISDGSSVLGLGNIGAEAAIPVMEGKALLFKELADIDAFPICLASQDVQKNVETIRNIAPVFGGINLEDFKAPECFEIENSLQDLGIPVMHDDQHGTAVVVLAGIINALKVVGRKINDVRIVLSGAGSAGTAVAKLLLKYGAEGRNVILCDTKGIIFEGRADLAGNKYKQELAVMTNTLKKTGTLADAMKGSDIFIGVSAKDIVSREMAASMAKDAVVFALSNPEPEIMPYDAREAGAVVVATGRSDFPNQVNNALAFPGIFRGALDAGATKITDGMKIAASEAIASLVEKPSPEMISPSILDKKVVSAVSEAVKKAWKNE